MEHPITPPPELLKEWITRYEKHSYDLQIFADLLSFDAAQWGADQELEACCNHIRNYQWGFVARPDGTKMHRAMDLQLARRPKPPSLKEQALAVLDDASDRLDAAHENILRRALEQLDD